MDPSGSKTACGSKTLVCSIGVMAHNEGAHIKGLLQSLLAQKTNVAVIKEIVVVASGCTDNTVASAEAFSKRDRRVKVLLQPQRLGKASAINYFLQNATADIYVIESGDTLPEEDTIEKLLAPFADPGIGMTGGHPVPQGSFRTFVEFAAHFLWKMHHALALKYPKLGELIAFRNRIIEIPADTSVDEAAIEALVTQKGYRLMYVPEARVYNRPPQTIAAFFNQRRRVFTGHLYLKKTLGYEVSSMNAWRIFCILVRNLEPNPWYILRVAAVIAVECSSRLLAILDVLSKKEDPYIWAR